MRSLRLACGLLLLLAPALRASLCSSRRALSLKVATPPCSAAAAARRCGGCADRSLRVGCCASGARCLSVLLCAQPCARPGRCLRRAKARGRYTGLRPVAVLARLPCCLSVMESVLLSAPWPCVSSAPLPLVPTPCCPARRVPPAWSALVARLPWRPARRGCGLRTVRSRPAKNLRGRLSAPEREQPGRRSSAVPCSVPAPAGWGRPLGAAGLDRPLVIRST